MVTKSGGFGGPGALLGPNALDSYGASAFDFNYWQSRYMRRLKEQFDPRGVLSPGRFLGRL